MAIIDVLIPTYRRQAALLMALTGVALQTLTDLRVVVADQNDESLAGEVVVQTLCRTIEARGGMVDWHHRTTRHGIAEQRAYLLDQATADYVLYLDDDVLMEPWVIERLYETIRQEGCGFVGAFPVGLSFRDDVRPHQQMVEYWTGPVRPEAVEPNSAAWEARWPLHCAANLLHVSQTLPPGEVRRYKVAWVGACALYDCAKLRDVGGYSFWSRLPRYHSGEEVLVQNLLMRRWGGCAILPSGTYHAEVETTVLNAAGTVDGHALELLQEMVERYAPERSGGEGERGRAGPPTTA